MYYAHSVATQPKDKWQSLQDHLNEVAAMAGRFAAPFGAQRAGVLAGMLHDLGKYTSAFQSRLDGDGAKVDHATAGAREACALAVSQADKITAELIAYAIAGHHAGLPDKIGGDASLVDRLKKSLPPLDPHWRVEIAPEADNLWPGLQLDFANKPRAAFQLGFLGRMIFSCLVDADYRDTESFYARIEGCSSSLAKSMPAASDRGDSEGEVLDFLVQNLGLHAVHEQGLRQNNRCENSHMPVRRREQKQQRFKSPGSAQRFLNVHAAVYNLFNIDRHLTSRRTMKEFRGQAFRQWRELSTAA